MKKKIIIISFLLLIIFIPIGYGIYNNRKIINKQINVFDMSDSVVNSIVESNLILKDYDDYKKYFNNDLIKEEDFKNNNYAVINFKYDPCTDNNIQLVDYNIQDNKLHVYFVYDRTCGVCPSETKYYLIKIDKSINNILIVNHYNINNDEYCDPTISYKPMIYIYPEKDMNISIKLGKPELLTTTYPKYNNGWNIYAKTNGDLIVNNRLYYGLYWEGINNINKDLKDGFVVSKDKLIPFFEEKLSILGLNEREANEFIVYWLPILEKNEYNLIRFEDIEVINDQMPLDINPKPDTIIRVLMEYEQVNKDYKIKEQNLKNNKREGFTIIEWGGTLLN